MGCGQSREFETTKPIDLIPGFGGKIFVRDANPNANMQSEYNLHRYQYSLSSHLDGSMEPAMIVYPTNEKDIITVIKYAEAQKISIAVRSGGHQYSGASSTNGPNIQLDLSETFLNPEDFHHDKDAGTVRVSVSYNLVDFNKKLGSIGLFVPHGQCAHVHLGGHCQTGGYGQLARGFGLFADHIVMIEIILPDCSKKKVTKETEPELFYAILGGSPGNWGVITHITIKPHRDQDHPHARGYKALYLYNPDRLKKLVDLMVEMSNDPDFPADFDFCITVLSFSEIIFHMFPDMDEEMRQQHWNYFSSDESKADKRGELPALPPSIILFIQWANLEGEKQHYDPTWMDRIKEVAGTGPLHILPYVQWSDKHESKMSQLTFQWVFPNVREYDRPYVKRTYVSNSTELVATGFSDWVTGRIDALQTHKYGDCKISAQIQNLGGKNARYFSKRDNGTSLSWRDTNMCLTMDAFYEFDLEKANQWQAENDAQALGPNGIFCQKDRRVLWGSWGEPDLDKMWDRYYDSRDKYDKLCDLKRKLDPKGIFTPNAFCVGGLKMKGAASQVDDVKLAKDHKEHRVKLTKNLVPQNVPTKDEQKVEEKKPASEKGKEKAVE